MQRPQHLALLALLILLTLWLPPALSKTRQRVEPCPCTATDNTAKEKLELQYQQAAEFEEQGEFKRAEKAYKAALAATPPEMSSTVARGNFHLGMLYSNRHKQKKVITHLEEALRLDPTLTRAYVPLANAYMLRNPQKMETYLNKALTLDPNDAHAYYTWGVYYLINHQSEKRLEMVRRLESLNPEVARILAETEEP